MPSVLLFFTNTLFFHTAFALEVQTSDLERKITTDILTD